MPDGAADEFRGSFPDVTFHVGNELPDATLAEVDAAFVTPMVPDDVIDSMPNLRWLHTSYGGIGTLLTPAVTARAIKLTTSRGVHAVPFAEFTIAAIFAMAKHFPFAVLAQAEHRWSREMPGPIEVAGTTLGIVGFGAIGSALAKLAAPLGMRVIATKQNVDGKPDYVDWIKPPEAMPELFAESDFIVLAIPAAPDLEGIINEQSLRSMKSTAVLINLTGRNSVPDEEIVARALREGWIGGAVFNVFNGDRGDISDDSPLWGAPNMLISPRIPALDPHKWDRLRALYNENLRRFIAGEVMINETAPAKGY
jgi:phosphoglycerate dehydrogenase-like enzyme